MDEAELCATVLAQLPLFVEHISYDVFRCFFGGLLS